MTRWNDSHRPYHRMLQQFTAAALVLLASVGWARQVSATPGTVGAGPVLALAIDPDTPATLYAGTPCSGVLKSLDGGDSWSAVNTGLTPLTTHHRPPVRALAIDPTTPTTLYAGTYGGVFRSLNGGSRIRVASENSQGSGGPATSDTWQFRQLGALSGLIPLGHLTRDPGRSSGSEGQRESDRAKVPSPAWLAGEGAGGDAAPIFVVRGAGRSPIDGMPDACYPGAMARRRCQPGGRR